jgi:integrase/recombinase XerC
MASKQTFSARFRVNLFDMPIQEFLKYLEFEKRYSSHTLKSYLVDLTQFSEFSIGHVGKFDPASIDHKLIRAWLVELVESGLSPRSANRKISTLKSFFGYLLSNGRIDKNPMLKIISPKIDKKLPSFVEKDHINHLLDFWELKDTFRGWRDFLIIEIFYFTGIRLTELINLKVSDIHFHEMVLKVLGKRNKERLVPFTNALVMDIKRYLDLRKKELGSYEAADYLLVTDSGKKMYPVMVYRIVKSYLQLVTQVEKRSPHVLRHTFATHMLNNGADLNAIKELLGHSNLSATQVYTHNTFEKLKKVYKQAHPRA